MTDPNKTPLNRQRPMAENRSIRLAIIITALVMGILAAVLIVAAILAQATSTKDDNGETIYIDIGKKEEPGFSK